jgi:hypothetical protein
MELGQLQDQRHAEEQFQQRRVDEVSGRGGPGDQREELANAGRCAATRRPRAASNPRSAG